MSITLNGSGTLSTTGSSFDCYDNLNFVGSGLRITGDFSNATVTNRTMFQTAASNSNSYVGLLPSGTGSDCRYQAYNSSDPANSSFASFGVVGATDVRLQSALLGTGTYLPMTFYTGGSERMRIDTSGQQTSTIVGFSGTYPEYKCRAWVNFNGTGTVAIRASGNVSSITDNGTGYYSVNFTNSMPDTNYSVEVTSQGVYNGVSIGLFGVGDGGTNVNTGSFSFNIRGGDISAGSPYDSAYVCVAVFR